jgi:hypothetical protein
LLNLIRHRNPTPSMQPWLGTEGIRAQPSMLCLGIASGCANSLRSPEHASAEVTHAGGGPALNWGVMTITAETSSVPGFVAELVRAANEVDRLTAGEIESMLRRAVTTVRDLREQAGIPGSGTERDAIVRLDVVAKGVAALSDENASAILREAADMVRTLWIVVDSGTVVSLKVLRGESE